MKAEIERLCKADLRCEAHYDCADGPCPYCAAVRIAELEAEVERRKAK